VRFFEPFQLQCRRLLLVRQRGGLEMNVLEQPPDHSDQEDEDEIERDTRCRVDDRPVLGQGDQDQECAGERSRREAGTKSTVECGEHRRAHGKQQVGALRSAGHGECDGHGDRASQ
jgi:hypothetical protein